MKKPEVLKATPVSASIPTFEEPQCAVCALNISEGGFPLFECNCIGPKGKMSVAARMRPCFETDVVSARDPLEQCYSENIDRLSKSFFGMPSVGDDGTVVKETLGREQDQAEASAIGVQDEGAARVGHDNMRKNRKKSLPWTATEDDRLVVAVNRYGARDWRKIAEYVGISRTSSQCNQRWCRALDPSITRAPWTPEEDQHLLRAVEIFGPTSWCQVNKVLRGRTDLQCRYRYVQLRRMPKADEICQAKDSGDVIGVGQVAERHPRRNSISIAPFAPDVMHAAPDAQFQMLPDYLEASMKPRDTTSSDASYLHRVPPIMFPRAGRTAGSIDIRSLSSDI
jgi:hypothetical protein